MTAFGAPWVAAALDAIDRDWRGGGACVALSGGLDSVVLLHAMSSLAAGRAFKLRALHVDHGLHRASGDWAESCRRTCLELSVPLTELRLRLVPQRGDSVEAAAREARYAALADSLARGERLLTAHHRDDQLETVLIQLLRGAGVAGLAAMPARAPCGGGWHLRPFLGTDRAQIQAYAEQHALSWQEDPMNTALRFDRAWLRARVLPAIRERWPAAATTVSRSASHLAEASRLLDAQAAADAADLIDDGRLSLSALEGLDGQRQANVLRWWLRRSGLRAPPAARLAEALRMFRAARDDASPVLRWRDGELRRYRGRLYAMAPIGDQRDEVQADVGRLLPLGPGLGQFGLLAGHGGGLPADSRWTIRFRQGGESLRPHSGRPRKRLKDLCQEAGIVPWMRDRLPLVFGDGRLVAVGDLWLDADVALPDGVPSLLPCWRDRPPLY
jgi:tRNA(Ile)-lysidine synthase